MPDHEFNNFERTIEGLARDLEILEKPVNRRFEAPQARPDTSAESCLERLMTSQLLPIFKVPARARMA